MSASMLADTSLVEAFNELEQFEDISECARLIAIGGMSERYNRIAEMAYEDHDAAMKAFQAVNEIPSSMMHELLWVKNVVLTHICNLKVASGKTPKPAIREIDIQRHFFKHLNSYVKGATKASPDMTVGHHPDGFILVDGFIAPVEVKIVPFRRKSLEQLEWYMRVYGANIGFAVAPCLVCELPPSVQFVKVTPEEVIAAQLQIEAKQ